jgi:hypothetical protein
MLRRKTTLSPLSKKKDKEIQIPSRNQMTSTKRQIELCNSKNKMEQFARYLLHKTEFTPDTLDTLEPGTLELHAHFRVYLFIMCGFEHSRKLKLEQ